MGMLTIKSCFAVTHCVERTDFDQVSSLVLFNRNMPKNMTGFSHAPLETAFTLQGGEGLEGFLKSTRAVLYLIEKCHILVPCDRKSDLKIYVGQCDLHFMDQ